MSQMTREDVSGWLWSFIQLNRIMKAVGLGQQMQEFHEKCVCQICSCEKHKCPNSQIHIPHQEISTYQKEFIRHPINTWKKPPPETPAPYRPYDNINSSYRDHYPGQKPTMRQKIVPRVKNESKSIPFTSSSEYFNQFGPKKTPIHKPFIKDNQYNPDQQPFSSSTTYGSHFVKQPRNPHEKSQPQQITFPDGYRFNPSTTYNSDFEEKALQKLKNYKPEERVGEKGPHDLNTIYRQDYKEKPPVEVCPVLRLPSVPSSLPHPSQHVTYNKFSGSWVEK